MDLLACLLLEGQLSKLADELRIAEEVVLEELVEGVASHEIDAAWGEDDEKARFDVFLVEGLDETLGKASTHQLVEFQVVLLLAA